MESAEEDDSPYSQTCRRRDPVYLASMAAHALPTSQVCFLFSVASISSLDIYALWPAVATHSTFIVLIVH